MLKKQIAIFNMILYMFIVWLFYYITNNDKKMGRLIAKKRWQEVVTFNLKRFFFDKFEINGNMKSTNKVNLIISNHISGIDIIIIVAILNHFNITDWYFVFKDSLLKIPVLGALLGDDIKLTRNWETDKNLLETQLKNIKKGTIIIYPEGTRFTTSKHKKSIKFCYQNKLPIYNYTLAPKARGFHCMYKILKENNNLGNIYNLTLIIPKFINRNVNPFNFESFENIHIYIEQLNLDDSDLIYENVKKRLFSIWLEKNMMFDKLKRIKNFN